MKDDPKWKDSGYSPEKAWGEIKQAEVNRKYADARFPIGTFALVVLMAALVVGGVIWVLTTLAR